MALTILWYLPNLIVFFWLTGRFGIYIIGGLLILRVVHFVFRYFVPKRQYVSHSRSFRRPHETSAIHRQVLVVILLIQFVIVGWDFAYSSNEVANPLVPCGAGRIPFRDNGFEYETDPDCQPLRAYKHWGSFTSVYFFDQNESRTEDTGLRELHAERRVYCTKDDKNAERIKSQFYELRQKQEEAFLTNRRKYEQSVHYARRTTLATEIQNIRQLPHTISAFIPFSSDQYRANN